MSIKTKRMSDIERRDRAIEKVRNEEAYVNSLNNLAMQRDLKERFGEYDKDISVGDMYQRKKKGNSRAHMKSYCPDGIRWVPKPEKISKLEQSRIKLLKGDAIQDLAEFLIYEKMRRDGPKNVPNRMMNEYVERKKKAKKAKTKAKRCKCK